MLLFFTHDILWYWLLLQLEQLGNLISAFVEMVSSLSISIPIVAVDVNLLEEEIGWKGVVEGDIRPLKAMVLRVMVVCPPPHFHYY